MGSKKTKQNKSDKRLRACVQVDGIKYWVQAYDKKELDKLKLKKRLEVEMQNSQERLGAQGNKSVKEWSEEWLLLHKRDKINPRYYKDIEGQLNNWILPVIGNKKLKDVKQKDIQEIMNEMEGRSRSYMNKVLLTIKGIMKQAWINHYIVDATITEGISMPTAKKTKERRAITEEERDVILSVAKTFEGGVFYLIMLYAGLRPGEVAALRWKHVDFEKKLIHVRDTVKSDDSIADAEGDYNGKTVNATRDVFLSQYLENELLNLQEKEKPKAEDFIAHKRRSNAHHTKTSMRTMWESFRLAMHIYMGGETDRSLKKYKENKRDDEGNVISSRIVKYTVEIPIEDKVAKDLVPYNLRHTFCTDLRDSGVPIEEAKDLMGHADIALTAKVYSHPTKTSINRAKELYENRFDAHKA